MRFLPQGAATYWVPHSFVGYNYTVATLVHTGTLARTRRQWSHLMMRAQGRDASMTRLLPLVIPPCVASTSLVGTKEERKRFKRVTNPCNSTYTREIWKSFVNRIVRQWTPILRWIDYSEKWFRTPLRQHRNSVLVDEGSHLTKRRQDKRGPGKVSRCLCMYALLHTHLFQHHFGKMRPVLAYGSLLLLT